MTCITDIENDFNRVLEYSQEVSGVDSHQLLEKWYEAKKYFIDKWNGELILEYPEPVVFHLDEQEKKMQISEFIFRVETNYDNYDLAIFLQNLDTKEIFDNKLEKDYADSVGRSIQAGSKIIKAFKYFETNERVLREMQDELSAIIQEDKITGTLCLSVHPLDFLSASENQHKWRSCHALDGEYRAGNLSYLTDSSTIMCYLKSDDKKVKLPHFPEDVPWNSKKWRMWLFSSDDYSALFAGRQYPFFSKDALYLSRSLLLGKTEITWSDWYDDILTEFPRKNYHYRDCDLYGRHVSMRNRIFRMRDFVEDVGGDDALHFNDVLESSCYVPYYCWSRYGSPNIHFTIGSSVNCICCSATPLLNSDMMICRECFRANSKNTRRDVKYCECCDSRCLIEDMVYCESCGDFICNDCAESECCVCEKCGSTWYNRDIVFDKDTNKWLCPDCKRGWEPDDDDWLPF